MPIGLMAAIMASLWLARVGAFREQEAEYLVGGKYDSALDDHKPMLSWLISEGDRIVSVAKKNSLGKLPSGIHVCDLEATVNSLLVTYKCQHGERNSPAVSAAIQKILDVA